jgi:4a-hydroxytetrahydrobiopterin dehydratase
MEQITAEQFQAADGVGDWRADGDVAQTRYRIPTFTDGARFVVAVAELADAMDHHPDVDLRYGAVSIRLTTHDAGGLSDRDVQLARRIAEAAHKAGLEADPAGAA